jgi:hypothetical protein
MAAKVDDFQRVPLRIDPGRAHKDGIAESSLLAQHKGVVVDQSLKVINAALIELLQAPPYGCGSPCGVPGDTLKAS